jgi:hypothetical protein
MRWLALAAVLVATPALAQEVVTSTAPDKVAVTIYRAPGRSGAMDLDWLEGYALVTETRTVAIPAGKATIRFEGVAGGMLPESALVKGLPGGVREKNLDADLLSPRSLYARSFGRPVILRREHPKSGKVTEERAIVRSGPDGAIIIQTRAGFEAADCGPLNDSLVYPEVPKGLSPRPTLSVETDASVATQATITLSYLAWGFDWQTNYVLHMHEDGKHADLLAWVTLASSDPTSFADAETAVVAGELNRESTRDDSERYDDDAGELIASCFLSPVGMVAGLPPPPMEMAAPVSLAAADIVVTAQRRTEKLAEIATKVEEEGLGDLKLYRVPIPTTVAANAQKQVAMYLQPNFAAKVVYVATIFDGDVGGVIRLIRARNRKEDGLGIPLPGGPVAVFEPHGERQLLVGEGALGNMAIGEDVEIKFAGASNVSVESKRVADENDWDDYEVAVSNANPWPVRFEGYLAVSDDYRLERPSQRLGRKNGRPLWAARVPANGSAKLRYRLIDAH